ncbi:phosphoglycerate mutase [Ramaria rubella]|nr:phosphoglycerate mutase [Ramaria rubella]
MIIITFVRHGESVDNLRSVWAGWKDAPLSNHGIHLNQAKACGQSFSTTHLSAIYASPLKRAHTTAQAIFDAQSEPRPAFIVSPDLREQHFGIAEGESWSMSVETTLDIERKVFPILVGRDAKFPGAESLNDLAIRANRAVEELILPWIWDVERGFGKGEAEVHLAVVSHGLCISELVSALVKRDADGYGHGGDYRGLVNTAWSRVTVALKDEGVILTPASIDKATPLVVRVTHVNQHDHLAGIKRQKGGIGSTAYDPKQKDIREFFGGGGSRS